MLKKIIFPLLCCAFYAFTAKAAPISTPYYSITLPSGWEQLSLQGQMDSQKPLQMFANKNLDCTIGLSVAENNETAQEAAKRGQEEMKAAGYTVSPLTEKDGILSCSLIKASEAGRIYYASNGRELSVTTIWCADQANAKSFFDALKPIDPSLFPKF